MSEFRKKPVVVRAVQITDEWFDGPHPSPAHHPGVLVDIANRCVEVPTLEGPMTGRVGDWLITGVKGKVYPCKPDIFEATYEPAGARSRSRSVVDEVLAERERQRAPRPAGEGWDEEHDAMHRQGDLSRAAAGYATGAFDSAPATHRPVPFNWPWDPCWWKPKGARRDLIRAAALIVAEIERLDRQPDRERPSSSEHRDS